MTLSNRIKFAEMIFFLGWKRHKDDVYTPQSILDLVHQNMDFIQSRPFLESEYLRIFGLDNPFTRSRDVFILIFWIKLKDEFDLIYRRLFNNNTEDFVNFYYSIIHKLYRYHHFVDRRTLNIDFWVNPKGCESNDIDAFPDFSLPPYWKVELERIELEDVLHPQFFHTQFNDLFLEFLIFLLSYSHKIIGGQLTSSQLLVQKLKKTLVDLGYSYMNYFYHNKKITELFLYLTYKKEIKLLYLIIKEKLNQDGLRMSPIFSSILFGLDIEDDSNPFHISEEETFDYEYFRDKDLSKDIVMIQSEGLSRINLRNKVEIVDRREFFRRFWEIPDL